MKLVTKKLKEEKLGTVYRLGLFDAPDEKEEEYSFYDIGIEIYETKEEAIDAAKAMLEESPEEYAFIRIIKEDATEILQVNAK